ncbi:MAG: hypothetical protein KHW37_07220, partial [Collinsella intestinalis]|nr:hypothetical protein [Collinsella intestinalis]
MFEPEVAAVATEASLDVTDAHDELEFKRALDRVDGQLAEVLTPAFASGQEARPSAEALRDALSALCARYAQNVRRALRGERLIPCRGEVRRREGRSPYAVNRLIGVVGMALSGAALVTVICVTALLLDGVTVLFRFGSFAARGEVPAALVGLTLAFRRSAPWRGALGPASRARASCAERSLWRRARHSYSRSSRTSRSWA